MENMIFNYIDIGILVVCLISGVLAFMRGLVHEFLAINSWILSILGVIYLFDIGRPYAGMITSNEMIGDIITSAVIFIAILVMATLITRILAEQIQKSALGLVDRIGGLGFGILRGWLIACIIYIITLWVLTIDGRPEAFDQSLLLQYIRQTLTFIFNEMPTQFNDNINEFIIQIQTMIQEIEALEKKTDNMTTLKNTIDNILGGDILGTTNGN